VQHFTDFLQTGGTIGIESWEIATSNSVSNSQQQPLKVRQNRLTCADAYRICPKHLSEAPAAAKKPNADATLGVVFPALPFGSLALAACL